MRTFISFDEARTIVLESAIEKDTESIYFEEAIGRTLREDIRTSEPVPPFDNSAMDGYAVRHEDCDDVPATLEVVSDIPAGASHTSTVGPGQAARIMTGAPVPLGANAIVPVEKTHSEDRSIVVVEASPSPGAHIRRSGEELSENELVMRAGLVFSPPGIGMLASLGKTKVKVSCRPRLAIISTGDEIIPPDRTPGPGQIRNSNGPSLCEQARAAGADVTHSNHLPDDRAQIRAFVESVQDVDLIVFSGGVSMGEYDFVRTELDAMGARWSFWKVKQRPGKPLAFGSIRGIPILGLPGNPVSSSICFEMYARPLIAKMLGRNRVFRKPLAAVLGGDIPKVEHLYTFARGILGAPNEDSEMSGRVVVHSTGNQASSMFTSMVEADCIIHLPDGMPAARAGMEVRVELLSW